MRIGQIHDLEDLGPPNRLKRAAFTIRSISTRGSAYDSLPAGNLAATALG
jgi:hypothetical protein